MVDRIIINCFDAFVNQPCASSPTGSENKEESESKLSGHVRVPSWLLFGSDFSCRKDWSFEGLVGHVDCLLFIGL